MAGRNKNVRRVLRRIKSPAKPSFDEQFWPVCIALVVLWGFLCGSVIAFQRFDAERLIDNAALNLVIVSVLMSLAVVFAWRVGNRYMRRTMQLAVVVCAIVHVVLVLLFLRMDVLSDAIAKKRKPRETKVRVKPRVVDEHIHIEEQERLEEQLTANVETELPQPQVTENARTAEQAQLQDAKVSPSDNEASQQQVEVAQMERTEASQARQSDQLSKMSRTKANRQVRPDVRMNATVQEQPNQQQSAPKLQPSNSASRVASSNSSPNRQSADPQRNRQVAENRAQRNTIENTPKLDAANPLQRRRPTNSAIADTRASAPAATQQTNNQAIEPSTRPVNRQVAQSTNQRQVIESEVPDRVDSQRQTRQTQSNEQPNIAQTPQPVPANRPRRTLSPNSPTPIQATEPTEAQTQPRLNVASRDVPRSSNDAQANKATAEPSAQVAANNSARVQASNQPQMADSNPTQNMRARRQVNATPNTAATSVAENATPNARPTLQPNENASSSRMATNSTADRRSGVSSVEADVNVTSTATRSNRSISNAAVQQDSQTSRIQRRVAQASQVPSGAVATPNATSESSTADALQPAKGSAARAIASSEGTGAKADSEATDASSQLTVSNSARAQTQQSDGVPTMANSNDSPGRSARRTNNAAMSTYADSVAPNTSPSPNNEPALNASPRALSKASTGTAGVGKAKSLDRTDGTPNAPAELASGAAREAVNQSLENGPELNQQSVKNLGRSVASDTRPQASMKAQSVVMPEVAGSRTPGKLDASAAAVTENSRSNASAGAGAGPKSMEIEVGQTQRTPGQRSRRAAGGGRPQLNSQVAERSNRRAGSARQGGPTGTKVQLTEQPAERGGATAGAPGGLAATTLGQPGKQSGGTTGDRAEISADAAPAGQLAGQVMQRSTDHSGADEPSAEADLGPRRRVPRRNIAAPGGAALAGPPTQVPAAAPIAGGSEGEAVDAKLASSGGATRMNTGGTQGSGKSEPGAEAGITTNSTPRGEVVEAQPGLAQVGGARSPARRRARGPQFAANRIAAVPNVNSGDPSTGKLDAAPFESQGSKLNVGGGIARVEDTGQRAPTGGEQTGVEQTLAAATNERRGAGGDEDEPPMDQESVGGNSAGRRRSSKGIRVASQTKIDVGSEAGGSGDKPDMSDLAAGTKVGPVAPAASTKVDVEVRGPEGIGGLGQIAANNPGVNDRTAQPDNENVALSSGRFRRRNASRRPSLSVQVAAAAEAFKARTERPSGRRSGGFGPQTEIMIDRGLEFLARIQRNDGSWRMAVPGDEAPAWESRTAATGLAMLAFQGAGYNHLQYKYKERLTSAVQYMVNNQASDGDLYIREPNANVAIHFYSHSIAALALCEAYGMTQDPDLREPAQRSLDFILKIQNKNLGGWRYLAAKNEADLSVTGWMMMALKSGQLAGLKVPEESFDLIRKYLKTVEGEGEPHLFRYNHMAPRNQAHGRRPSPSMTSVGMLLRMYLGSKTDGRLMVRGADSIMRDLPENIESGDKAGRDTYYWYYASQVMYHMGGDYWKRWNARLHPLLAQTQAQGGRMAGSWHPMVPVPDKWGNRAGRLYVTTLNLLSLEVTHRHLPLYVGTIKQQ